MTGCIAGQITCLYPTRQHNGLSLKKPKNDGRAQALSRDKDSGGVFSLQLQLLKAILRRCTGAALLRHHGLENGTRVLEAVLPPFSRHEVHAGTQCGSPGVPGARKKSGRARRAQRWTALKQSTASDFSHVASTSGWTNNFTKKSHWQRIGTASPAEGPPSHPACRCR
jgi:hypothetical protein